MRYQSLDSEAVSNGRRMGSNPNWKTYKEDEEEDRVMEEIINSGGGVNDSLESKASGLSHSRFRSPSNNYGIENSNNNDRDVLLQWGHRKKSRCSRGMMVSQTTTDDSSSSSSASQFLHPNKLQGRSSPSTVNINNNNTNGTMHPPSLPSSCNGLPKPPNSRSSSRIASSTASPVRGIEERSATGGDGEAKMVVPSRCRAAVKKSPSRDKKAIPASPPIITRPDSPSQTNHPEAISVASKSAVNDASNCIATTKPGGGVGEKINGVVEVHDWPRIYIALSKKEKEEDFMAMKGSKLPHRPKKRPKAIDRMLQYCYPGMWLSDLTRGRYEVREKKSTKKVKFVTIINCIY
ncbi:hypothetical protein LIER_24728 [Lithospermum erythrorhizon]|uniref:Uncharacterized protein n=1 Tax=Lithospermum erythrorhizon TaxID=34254 RepID=A0AAV3R5X5_LITER